MNRARGESAIRRSKETEHCDYAVKRVRIYRFFSAASIDAIVGALLSLARCQHSEQIVSLCSSRESTPRATGGRSVRYARRPPRTLFSHDHQRTSRKLSAHAVILCAPCSQYTAQALSARGKRSAVLAHAFGLPAIVAGWTLCATSTASAAAASTATATMHSPTHRRLRQALRRQRCTARPLFTRPAWPRRALR
jgi:hypothetical protein